MYPVWWILVFSLLLPWILTGCIVTVKYPIDQFLWAQTGLTLVSYLWPVGARSLVFAGMIWTREYVLPLNYVELCMGLVLWHQGPLWLLPFHMILFMRRYEPLVQMMALCISLGLFWTQVWTPTSVTEPTLILLCGTVFATEHNTWVSCQVWNRLHKKKHECQQCRVESTGSGAASGTSSGSTHYHSESSSSTRS